MTNRELLLALRQPGKIEMPILSTHNIFHFHVEKSDVIATIAELDPEERADWTIVLTHPNGTRRLDVA